MKPIKTTITRDENGAVIVPEGYRFVPQITRVRNGQSEIIREHCRLIRPVKQRLSMKRQKDMLWERQCRGETGPLVPVEQNEDPAKTYASIRAQVIACLRREMNRVLAELERGD